MKNLFNLCVLLFSGLVLLAQSGEYSGTIADESYQIIFQPKNNANQESIGVLRSLKNGTAYTLNKESESTDFYALQVIDHSSQLIAKMKGVMQSGTFYGKYYTEQDTLAFNFIKNEISEFQSYQWKDSIQQFSNEKLIAEGFFSMKYTVFKDNNKNRVLLSAIEDKELANVDMDAYIAQSFQLYQESIEQTLEGYEESESDWVYRSEWQDDLSPLKKWKDCWVFVRNMWMYEGGAHGMGNTQFITYNTVENKVLGFSDFFKPQSEEEIKHLLNQHIKKELGMEEEENLQSLNVQNNGFLVDELPYTPNFYPSDKGITFLYNPYEVKAYAYGSYEITLSWEELGSVLKK